MLPKFGIDKKQSLIALGLEMAAINEDGISGHWVSPKTKKALLELEKTLGIRGTVSSNLLFVKA